MPLGGARRLDGLRGLQSVVVFRLQQQQQQLQKIFFVSGAFLTLPERCRHKARF